MSLKSSSVNTSNGCSKYLVFIQLFVYTAGLFLLNTNTYAWNSNKNQVTVIVGVGPTKPVVNKVQDHLRVTQEFKTVYGIQYQRQFANEWKKGILILSNGTTAITLGLEY